MGLTESNIENLTGFAIETIQACGREALTYYGKGDQRIQFDEDLVTEAELHLTDFFRKTLGAHFPEHQIFNGNNLSKSYTHEEKRYIWILNPLDGVANFMAGIPIWGMSIALLENFWPVFGVFHMPATGDLFRAQAGREAFRGSEKIRISSQESISDESVLLTFSRFHRHYQPSFPGKIRNLGCTAAHICYVAMGRAEAALIANESYQDLAATQVIIEAAGGKIMRLDGKPFSFSEYMDTESGADHLLVLAPDLYSQVREGLKIK